MRFIWLLTYVGKLNLKVDFNESGYVGYESKGKICIGLTLNNQSSTDHDISVKLLNVDSNTDDGAKGMYVVPTI